MALKTTRSIPTSSNGDIIVLTSGTRGKKIGQKKKRAKATRTGRLYVSFNTLSNKFISFFYLFTCQLHAASPFEISFTNVTYVFSILQVCVKKKGSIFMSLNSLQSMFGPGLIFTHFHVNYMHLQLLFKIPLTNISRYRVSM